MCYTGLRYSDYVKFVKSDKLHHIINDSNKKTGALSDVPISPPVRKILQKHNGVLPTLISSQKIGGYVKEVCALIPSLQKMTYKIYTRSGRRVKEPCPRYMMVASHTSRRTFITIMKRWGIEDSSIMAVTGHRDIRTLRVYDKTQRTEVVQKVMTDVSVHFTDYETAE
jgi:site-specific recombinase XerD